MDQDNNKIVIVGPGAMGCLFAALLQAPGRELWLLDKKKERAELIAEQGVIIETGNEKTSVPVKATADPEEPGPARLVIVCVKAYDTEVAAKRAAPMVGEKTEVLSLQNGVGNVEALVGIYGPERVLGGTTAQGANLVGPGRVRHAGKGETVVGEPRGGTDRAERVADMFRKAGIEARATDDLDSLVWSKLLINAAINPLTAILGVRNGALAEMEPTRMIMKAAVEEVEKVCAKKGVKLGFPDPVEKALAVARATAENVSSMLADVRAKRRTEVDQISGAVKKEADAQGVPAPVNNNLALIIKAIEKTYNLNGSRSAAK